MALAGAGRWCWCWKERAAPTHVGPAATNTNNQATGGAVAGIGGGQGLTFNRRSTVSLAGGFGEIRLPPVQPGSSLMPGKVNPVIPEMVNQVAFTVIGGDLTITLAAEAGQLQLNPFEPLIAATLLRAIRLLSRAANTLASRCVDGITADEAAGARQLDAGAARATSLVPLVGYDRAAGLARTAIASGRPLRDIVVESGLLAPGTVEAAFGAGPR